MYNTVLRLVAARGGQGNWRAEKGNEEKTKGRRQW